jgi:hypothetical protein
MPKRRRGEGNDSGSPPASPGSQDVDDSSVTLAILARLPGLQGECTRRQRRAMWLSAPNFTHPPPPPPLRRLPPGQARPSRRSDGGHGG